MIKKLPRGIRNNNPFNIKKTAVFWFGECIGDDNVFETFSSLEYGVRAGLKLFRNYVRNNINTPRKILNRFAPYSENNTKNYLDFVCSCSHLNPDVSFCVVSDDFIKFCFSVIRFETGLNVSELSNYGITLSYLQFVLKRYIV